MARRRPRGAVRSRPWRRRDLWVGWRPNGVGHQKPHHYADMLRVVWVNRRSLPYAWRILRRGVCDGCALGVAGLRDWTIHGVHLCTTRLELLRVNTMGEIDAARLDRIDRLRALDGAELRDLGRLAHPLVRRRGEPGFRRVSWDEALDLVADAVRAAGPDRFATYLTARGLTNETYYVAQKAMRALGSPHVDNAARVCHAPSTVALNRQLGVGATTCSYTDVIDTDLVVLFGANVANAQPVFMKYLYLARQRGARVVVVNPLREPGLDRYWVPSNVESAVFGTRMTDDFFTVHAGGDAAFVTGVLKALLASGTVDRRFVTEHTRGFEDVLDVVERHSWTDLEAWSGAARADMERFAAIYGAASRSVLVWSMGITQHADGVAQVAAIVDLALARGNVGRRGTGLMPIRGHSGVQGGAEMGCYATALPGGRPIDEESASELERQWGFPVPARVGRTAAEMVEAAGRGDVQVLWSVGGNFLDVLPDPASVAASLSATPVRVHHDIVLTTQMLVDPGEVVVVLPAATRYEHPGGGTSTTTERRVAFSPEIPGPRIAEARAEWEVFADLVRRVAPERGERFGCEDAAAIRAEIGRVVPMYAGIERLRDTGDQVQWGGTRLCEGGRFPTADGRARFVAPAPRPTAAPPGRLLLSTRRGKQFNSMVFSSTDPLTGADRHDVLVAPVDAEHAGVDDGEPVLVRSDHGAVEARCRLAAIRPGNVQMFFPEANALLPPGRRDADAGVPDYNAVVALHPIEGAS